MRLRFITLGLACALSLGAAAGATEIADRSIALSQEPIQPLSRPLGLDPAKVALGRDLFSDPILSKDGSISCASCHPLSGGGTDHRERSIGVGGAEGTIRAPTVFNAGYNFAQFWDGRAPSLEAQAAGPVTNPLEMASAWPDVEAKLAAHSGYAARFHKIYDRAPSRNDITDAIATFERTLVTVNSRFDAYLKGDTAALNEFERRGYALFKAYGCASCHQGANVGGNMYQKFGFLGDYVRDRGSVTAADLGRYNVTHKDSDRQVFKVPSLRLTAINAPYFHDGSVSDLYQAIRIMGRYQLGRDIPDADIHAIAAFLGSLVGDMTGEAK